MSSPPSVMDSCASLPPRRTGRNFAIATVFESPAVRRDDAHAKAQRNFVDRTLQPILANKLRYAALHGYDFVLGNRSVCQSLSSRIHPAFAKICLLLHLLRQRRTDEYDWILLVDHDALIANPAVTLEEKLEEILGSAALDAHETVNSKDLVISQDWNGLNTGVMMVRGGAHTSWPEAFFHKLLHSPPRECAHFEPRWWEQGVLQCLLKRRENAAANWKIEVVSQQRKMNAYPEPYNFGRADARFEDGDFIAHFAGASGEETKFSSLLNKSAIESALRICSSK